MTCRSWISCCPPASRPVAVAAHTADPIGTGRACLAYLSVWLSTGVLAHVNVNWLSPTKIRTTVIGGHAADDRLG